MHFLSKIIIGGFAFTHSIYIALSCCLVRESFIISVQIIPKVPINYYTLVWVTLKTNSLSKNVFWGKQRLKCMLNSRIVSWFLLPAFLQLKMAIFNNWTCSRTKYDQTEVLGYFYLQLSRDLRANNPNPFVESSKCNSDRRLGHLFSLFSN